MIGKDATIENLKKELTRMNIQLYDDIYISEHIAYDYSEKIEYSNKNQIRKIITIDDAKYLNTSDCMIVFYYKNLDVCAIVDKNKKVEYLIDKAEN